MMALAHVGRGLTVYQGLPAGLRLQPCQDAKDGALPAPRRPQEGDELAFVGVNVDTVEGDHLPAPNAELLRKIADLDTRRCR